MPNNHRVRLVTYAISERCADSDHEQCSHEWLTGQLGGNLMRCDCECHIQSDAAEGDERRTITDAHQPDPQPC